MFYRNAFYNEAFYVDSDRYASNTVEVYLSSRVFTFSLDDRDGEAFILPTRTRAIELSENDRKQAGESVTSRKIGSTLSQGDSETIVYSITTTSWGSSPTDVVVKAYEVTGGTRTDVTDDVLSGSASVAGDVISLPAVTGLTAGKGYRIEVKFSSGGNTFEPYLEIQAEY